ncbi:MAG: electron transport complex subunit RsxC [gamma proteobacterium symbiont of Bathyaustriella thionipta]|nr:electron transport complex subunit RsxC [gamma proteobacterium symbiont of Bathyaustriella thionipta]MCU7949105.1 electron transport complex subunit RsxC [gamma proteobacterium symbiont of Bathyaustriella thionipta]MCU7952801.1 electron transport complex subunit RsxC [gamma proteobacterium symbiont of Bathyaustriella thionipta]MCU7955692.1 electron transport complex subunit RsxC [gamma proteobacterium symbiont of Bathyaustriella thionipta]MCU7968006.1 electron transport complex subunit RsxC 
MKENLYKLWSFPGGIKVSGNKSQSNQQPISTAKTARQLIIPLTQHIGQAAEPIVKVGDKVLKGQILAHANGAISAPVHASGSGVITAIEELPVPHPSGLSALCVVIDTDGYDQWIECTPLISENNTLNTSNQSQQTINTLSNEQINKQIANAGIVGLGGALFPSAAKLHTAEKMHTDTLIINAAECEPYITCDDVLMRRRPEEVILGILLIKKIVGAKKCLIGIEDNKPEAYQALLSCISGYNFAHKTNSAEPQIEIIPVPARYPAGGEKQLIQVLTGKEVPSGGLPMDVGIICHNVTTAAAVYQAVYRGEPLISRIVTITGGAIKTPQNMEVPIGTPIRDVLNQAGLQQDKIEKVIMGGPMMGFALSSIDVPVTKATNCLLISEKGELSTPPPAMPCIRCALCADSCPMSLLPQQMYWYAKARDLEKVQDYNLFDCIECGGCSYACPSNIPLVQYYRYAKTEIQNEERERNKANIARDRHEFREERLQKAKLAKAEAARLRKEKLAKKKALDAEKAKQEADKADNSDDSNGDSKEKSKAADSADLIQEAIARAKAKKAQQQSQRKNTENLTEAQQKQIDEANTRRRKTSQTD